MTPLGAIAPNSIVQAAKDQVSADLSGETIILSLRSGRYYGLSDAGVRIWELLREPRSVGEICEAVLAEYDVPREPCERDLVALLGQLADKGLIEVRHASPAAIRATSSG